MAGDFLRMGGMGVMGIMGEMRELKARAPFVAAA